MNIAIEARALSAKSYGVRRYVYELVRHLLALNQEDSYSLIYSNRSALSSFLNAQEIVVPLAHEVFLQRWLSSRVPQALKALSIDVVHFTKADVPKYHEYPTVVTVYDMIPIILPKTQSFLGRRYWPHALRRAATLSDHIITISNASKDDVITAFRLDESKISVIPLAIDHLHFKPASEKETIALKNNLGLPSQYILFVGRRDPRKNVTSLIEAYSMIEKDTPHDLVIAGARANVPDGAESLAAKLGVIHRVHFLNDVSHEDLPVLYSGAALFVWPSIIEGWGFPPQEAMACGTPVIVSNADPLREVVGAAGEVVSYTADDLALRADDMDFVERLASTMKEILGNRERQKQMRLLGFEHVKNFTWQDVALKTRDVYTRVAGH